MAIGIPTELGTKSVSKLLKQYAIPAIIAMTASSLYNMIDSVFIGHGVGKYAIAGLAVTFPLMNLGAAFGSLVGAGAATLTSVLLGQKNYEIAQKVLGNVVVLNLIVGALYMLGILLFLEPILFFFGASDVTVEYAKDYMEVILYGNIITHMYFGLNAVQRSSGFPKKAMIATVLTVVINTVLDPIFIYLFDMGIKGAAIATVISQFIALCLVVSHFSSKKLEVRLKRGIYKLNYRITKDIFAIGSAPFFINAAACLVVIIINNGLREHGGDLAIAAYGIVNRIAFIFLMIIMGINQGMQPIVGYNFGAKKMDRVMQTLKLTMASALVVSSIGFIIGQSIPSILAKIFTTDKELIDTTVMGMKIAFTFFPVVAIQMVAGNFFWSLGYAKMATFISLTRQLIVLLPLLIILPQFMGIKGVWLSLPIADLISSIVAAIILWYHIKKINK